MAHPCWNAPTSVSLIHFTSSHSNVAVCSDFVTTAVANGQPTSHISERRHELDLYVI